MSAQNELAATRKELLGYQCLQYVRKKIEQAERELLWINDYDDDKYELLMANKYEKEPRVFENQISSFRYRQWQHVLQFMDSSLHPLIPKLRSIVGSDRHEMHLFALNMKNLHSCLANEIRRDKITWLKPPSIDEIAQILSEEFSLHPLKIKTIKALLQVSTID